MGCCCGCVLNNGGDREGGGCGFLGGLDSGLNKTKKLTFSFEIWEISIRVLQSPSAFAWTHIVNIFLVYFNRICGFGLVKIVHFQAKKKNRKVQKYAILQSCDLKSAKI